MYVTKLGSERYTCEHRSPSTFIRKIWHPSSLRVPAGLESSAGIQPPKMWRRVLGTKQCPFMVSLGDE